MQNNRKVSTSKGKGTEIQFRVTPEEKIAIKNAAAENGMTMSAYLVECALKDYSATNGNSDSEVDKS